MGRRDELWPRVRLHGLPGVDRLRAPRRRQDGLGREQEGEGLQPEPQRVDPRAICRHLRLLHLRRRADAARGRRRAAAQAQEDRVDGRL